MGCNILKEKVEKNLKIGLTNQVTRAIIDNVPSGALIKYADVAHLVERHLAKVEVASSSLVVRSKATSKEVAFFIVDTLLDV